ncbi:MAG: NUDIX domain-containing protein [Clostridia bacterium]|nr:NUDIX domain-containing protein [Clostridia bacterium]
MELNCCFTQEGKWFRYRVGAIIVENGCVLFAGNDKVDYLYSVGGAVHMGETAEDAVRREVLEETGIPYEIDRPAFIHENFFSEDLFSREGCCDCHEISLYFLMKPRGTQELRSDSVTMGVREHMHWVPIDELDKHKAFPSFMKEYLQSEHSGEIEHYVTDERVKAQ